jgi:hypothetical protein
MTDWKSLLNSDPLEWLLEPDARQPAVRYFTLRDILGRKAHDPEVRTARDAAMSSGPIPKILAAQEPDGYWLKPGAGYAPKYKSSVWQTIFLAQLGADGANPQVKAGCEYVLNHSLARNGNFSVNGSPSGFIHCLAGNLASALIDLGWLEDKRLQASIEKQARFITGDGMATVDAKDTTERFYAFTPGPMFICYPNGGLACAWGAVKALNALGKVPPAKRTPVTERAITQGIEFLLSHDPAVADYPFASGKGPNPNWFKFGYPIGYITDMLQNLEVLAALGQARDERLNNALELVLGKQDASGRWKLEYSLNGKMWTTVEELGRPSKWITLRAIRVLKAAYPGSI